MKYTNETIINKPLDLVIKLFDNAENMKKWQPDLQSYELLEGNSGQIGAKMKLVYKIGKRTMEMVETITSKNHPDEFGGYYEMNGAKNIVLNRFIDLGNGTTKWISESEFILSGFMKIMGWIMPGTFKKQSQAIMDRFKAFAEAE